MLYQAAPGRSHDFPEPDFFGAVGGFSRGEIDKVDTGDRKDEAGDGSEQPDETHVAMWQFIIDARAEMHISNWL